nr:DNA polymerase delta subunit 4 isoform X2 [Saimiri boliviensis boliviensis]
MGRKRLITDSYPVVKRREGPAGHSKGELAPELGEEPQPPDEDEAELQLLRQFDLAWQYGPCTGENPPSLTEAPLPASPVTHMSLKPPKRPCDCDLRALSPPQHTHFPAQTLPHLPRASRVFFPPWQGSHGCSAGVGPSSWAWSLPQRCGRC